MPAPGTPGSPPSAVKRRRRWLLNRSTPAATDGVLASDVGLSCPLLAAVQRLMQDTAPITWVFTGDSITHGSLKTEGQRSYPEHFSERVRWEMRRFEDVVINTGVCNERSEGLLAAIDSRILRFQPEVAFILIGMNDCIAGLRGREQFRKNLTAIVERLRENSVLPVLQTPNLIYTPNASSRTDLPAYIQIIREVAVQMETALVDHWNDWCQARPEVGAILTWLQDASIHPNGIGHRVMAHSICRALGVFDPHSLTCSLATT